jgi:hypothetical protein
LDAGESNNSKVSLGNNDPSTVAKVFGNQDLNQASTNSTASLDSSNPSFYDSIPRSSKKDGPLTADDYVEYQELSGYPIKSANSQKIKLFKVATSDQVRFLPESLEF